MYTHSRLTSESSYETNASGSSQTTDSSCDNIIVDCAKTSKTYTGQGIEYLDPVRNASTIDSNDECQRKNVHLAEQSNCGGYIYIPSDEYKDRNIKRNSQGCKIGTKRESVPLLLKSQREYEVLEILRSQEFKKFFESEYTEMVKFRQNYKSLKKLFLTLAVLNIILIVCAVSVMPVTLVSLRLENSHAEADKVFNDAPMEEFVFEKLNSPRAKEIIRQQMFCRDCHHLSDKLEACKVDIQKVRGSIDALEDAVISLQLNRSNREVNGTETHLQNTLQKTLVHERVENNNKLLNKLLNWKRSSMQLTGTVLRNGQMAWQQDVLNGDIMSRSKNGIHVKSGGTYFLYTKIQFSKCTGTEKLEYHIMKKRGSTNTVISRAEQSCTVLDGFEQSLHVQKVVDVPLSETATFYIRYNSVVSGSFSKVFGTHVFGLIEI